MRWTEPAYLVLNAGATFRLTRLVTRDRITDKARKRAAGVTANNGLSINIRRPRLWYFLTCPWCTSIWIAAAVVAAAVEWTAWVYAAAALTFSAVAGLLADREA